MNIYEIQLKLPNLIKKVKCLKLLYYDKFMRLNKICVILE